MKSVGKYETENRCNAERILCTFYFIFPHLCGKISYMRCNREIMKKLRKEIMI